MKIRVLVDTYQHQGLYKGSEHDALWDEGTKTYNFVNYGKLWTLGPLQAVEVELLKEDDFPAPNEKLLDVINTDLKQDSVLDIQHGGSHYKDKKIQPIEYITANNLDFCQGNIVKSPSTACDFLSKALSLLEERGKDYDQPEGERSMGKTISAFNSITGKSLTESEGWLLLQLLKDVRQWQNPNKYHADSAEDCISYAALKAEALSRG